VEAGHDDQTSGGEKLDDENNRQRYPAVRRLVEDGPQ